MKHNIICKFKDTISKEEREAMYPAIYALFAKTTQIDGVHGIRLLPNCVDRSNRYHLVIEMDMDAEALPVYDACTWHKQWKEEYGAMLEAKTIIDLDAPFRP